MRRFLLVVLCVLAVPASASAWTWPVDAPVVRGFTFDPDHPYAAGQHRGIDIAVSSGTQVRAPASGIVTFAGTVPNGGKAISIETPGGYTATLLHLGSIAVAGGAAVGEGAVVASAGSDSFVYFGLRKTNEPQGYVDPLDFLPSRPSGVPSPEPAPAAASPATSAPAAEQPASRPAPPAAAPVPATGTAASASDARTNTQAATSQAEGSTPATAASPESPADAAPAAQTLTANAAGSEGSAPTARAEPANAVAPTAAVAVVRPTSRLVAVGSRSRSRVHAPRAEGPSARRSIRERAGDAATDASARSPVSATSEQSLRSLHHDGGTAELRPEAHPGFRAHDFTPPLIAVVVALLSFVAALLLRRRLPKGRTAARIMSLPGRSFEQEPTSVAAGAQEDSRRARVAVRERSEASRPRGGVRRAGRHLRAVPAPEGERRADGERDGRARDAGDGHGRQGRRLAA